MLYLWGTHHIVFLKNYEFVKLRYNKLIAKLVREIKFEALSKYRKLSTFWKVLNTALTFTQLFITDYMHVYGDVSTTDKIFCGLIIMKYLSGVPSILPYSKSKEKK